MTTEKSMEKNVEPDKKYILPTNLSYIEIDDSYLIISVDTANWLLLTNEKQLLILEMIKNHSVGEVFELLEINQLEEGDFIYVLTEIEAKDFENTTGSPPKSKGMCIYLTNKCNLRCKHCYMYAGEKLENELETIELINLLSEFKHFGGKEITFTGGEVALRKDLLEILKHSKDIGLSNTILTNGILWDNDLIENSFKYIDEIQISIDGYDEKSNSEIRGVGHWSKALEAVELFCEKGVRVSVVITPLYENISNEKDKYIKFVKNLNAKYIDFDFNIRFSYELLMGREIKPSDQANKEYTKIMKLIEAQCYPGNRVNKFALNHENNIIIDNCGYGEITVTADGSLYFCNRVPELHCYGNIRNISFEKVWELSTMATKMSNVNNLKPCKDCEIKYICGGGCRIAYFPDLIKEEELYGVHSFGPRECNTEYKNSFYRLMIEANELFYR